ncbi:protein vestigial [Cylas formicarius]|uniref:protein vestigial n=1 Tax=Cylas formicarius TaxID=197179 RepID=UPI002958B089|nr:protein vestigial [Cylas formicarius]
MYIMSCSEVMYQAYYPYLYQRAGAAPPVSAHPVPRTGPFSSPFGAAHQYDRFNVQRLQDAHTLSAQSSVSGAASSASAASVGAGSVLGDTHAIGASSVHPHHPLYLQGSAHSSGGSVSSTGGGSPTSPLRPGKEEDCSLHGRSSTEGHQQADDDDSQDGGGGSRAQYVSANCVVFTHYQGDTAAVVDEHFNRALDKTSTHSKESSPMSARNFPPSFWNSQHYAGASGGHHGTSAADLYSEHYHPGDAWYQYSQHHRAVHDYHHHNMAAQYGGLLLPGSRLHMSSHAPCKAMDWQHPSIESAYSSYPSMSGLEAQVQDSSKDLYWF